MQVNTTYRRSLPLTQIEACLWFYCGRNWNSRRNPPVQPRDHIPSHVQTPGIEPRSHYREVRALTTEPPGQSLQRTLSFEIWIWLKMGLSCPGCPLGLCHFGLWRLRLGSWPAFTLCIIRLTSLKFYTCILSSLNDASKLQNSTVTTIQFYENLCIDQGLHLFQSFVLRTRMERQ